MIRPLWYLKLESWFVLKVHNLFYRLGLPVCEGFQGPCYHFATKTRQHTMHEEEWHNWVFLCPKCKEMNDAHWQGMWDDYNSGRL